MAGGWAASTPVLCFSSPFPFTPTSTRKTLPVTSLWPCSAPGALKVSSLPHEQPGVTPVSCHLHPWTPSACADGPFHEVSPGSLPDAFSPQGVYPGFGLMGGRPGTLCPAVLPNCLPKPHSMCGLSGAVALTMPPDPAPCPPPGSCHPAQADPFLTRVGHGGGTVASQGAGLGAGPAAPNPPAFSHLRALAFAAPSA